MSSRSPRFGIVVSRFNLGITELLLAGALICFRKHRVPERSVDVRWVPGAFELPVAALRMAKRGRCGAVVALGCILEGETPQFRYLSEATYLGLSLAGVMSGVPITSGVITAKSWRHARERANPRGLNRGGEAAQAAWEMSRQAGP